MQFPAWKEMTDDEKFEFLNLWLANSERAIQGIALQLEDVRGRLLKVEAAISEKK